MMRRFQKVPWVWHRQFGISEMLLRSNPHNSKTHHRGRFGKLGSFKLSEVVTGKLGFLCLAMMGFDACLPSFEERPWLIEEPRIVAIRSVPAEQRPNQSIALEALLVSPDGLSSTPVTWDYCLRPRTTVERTSVSASCIEGRDLQPVMATTTILADACARFGPNPPPVEGDEVGQRPADPDPSGGYFLPVRASLMQGGLGNNNFSFGQVRIRCDLAGATREIFDAFQERYRENQNPEILDLKANSASIRKMERSSEGIIHIVVPSDQDIDLVVDVAASSFEPYVVYRGDLGRLLDDQETLRLSWYVSAGELEQSEQVLQFDGRLSNSLNIVNRWRSPEQSQVVPIWVVLRDSRGGSAWIEGRITVASLDSVNGA